MNGAAASLNRLGWKAAMLTLVLIGLVLLLAAALLAVS